MGQIHCCSKDDTPLRKEITPTLICEYDYHSLIIRVTQGNLIDENVDAILMICDQQLFFDSYYVKQAILFGGRSMKSDLNRQCQKLKTIEFGDVIYCHSGELDFDYVFFAVLPSCYQIDADYVYKEKLKSSHHSSLDDCFDLLRRDLTIIVDQKQYVQQAIKRTLYLCLELGLKSISFPIIISEGHEHQKSYSSLVMLVAIKQVMDENPLLVRNMDLINFTVADKEYLKSLKIGLNQLIKSVPIVDVYETPQLRAEQPLDNLIDSNEQDFNKFGHKFKNRRERISYDSI